MQDGAGAGVTGRGYAQEETETGTDMELEMQAAPAEEQAETQAEEQALTHALVRGLKAFRRMCLECDEASCPIHDVVVGAGSGCDPYLCRHALMDYPEEICQAVVRWNLENPAEK